MPRPISFAKRKTTACSLSYYTQPSYYSLLKFVFRASDIPRLGRAMGVCLRE